MANQNFSLWVTIGTAIGVAVLAVVLFLGTLLGGIGLFLATVMGTVAFGTIAFWQSFGIAMIFCVLVGVLVDILAKLFRRE